MQHSLFENMQPNDPRQPALRQADVSVAQLKSNEKKNINKREKI